MTQSSEQREPRGARRCARRRARLTFIGRLRNQFSEAVENIAAEQEQNGEVTIHVAGAEGSERSISP